MKMEFTQDESGMYHLKILDINIDVSVGLDSKTLDDMFILRKSGSKETIPLSEEGSE